MTKDGRTTDVSLIVADIHVVGASIRSYVVYRIYETAKNYTTLEWADWVEVPLPPNWTVNQIFCSATYASTTFSGENHNLNPLPLAPGGCLADAKVKFDGKGRDDNGNAYAELHFNFLLDISESF